MTWPTGPGGGNDLGNSALSGQIRFRVRYHHLATPYFDYLMVSPEEMQKLVAGTGWHVARVRPSAGSAYIAVLEKQRPPARGLA